MTMSEIALSKNENSGELTTVNNCTLKSDEWKSYSRTNTIQDSLSLALLILTAAADGNAPSAIIQTS